MTTETLDRYKVKAEGDAVTPTVFSEKRERKPRVPSAIPPTVRGGGSSRQRPRAFPLYPCAPYLAVRCRVRACE